jgi:hypothetical protein
MTYTLTRISQSSEGTFGLFTDPTGLQLCVTCEPPPDTDHPCIPAGTYQVIPHNSPAHPNTWEISNVPGRTAILIHNGNTDADTLGCVVVGKSFGWIGTQQAIMESDVTLGMLQQTLPQNFSLNIVEQFA